MNIYTGIITGSTVQIIDDAQTIDEPSIVHRSIYSTWYQYRFMLEHKGMVPGTRYQAPGTSENLL